MARVIKISFLVTTHILLLDVFIYLILAKFQCLLILLFKLYKYPHPKDSNSILWGRRGILIDILKTVNNNTKKLE